jgi:hypothetical protein
MFPMVCVCGHPIVTHHATPAGRITWCSVFSPNRCGCEMYVPREEDQP